MTDYIAWSGKDDEPIQAESKIAAAREYLKKHPDATVVIVQESDAKDENVIGGGPVMFDRGSLL